MCCFLVPSLPVILEDVFLSQISRGSVRMVPLFTQAPLSGWRSCEMFSVRSTCAPYSRRRRWWIWCCCVCNLELFDLVHKCVFAFWHCFSCFVGPHSICQVFVVGNASWVFRFSQPHSYVPSRMWQSYGPLKHDALMGDGAHVPNVHNDTRGIEPDAARSVDSSNVRQKSTTLPPLAPFRPSMSHLVRFPRLLRPGALTRR